MIFSACCYICSFTDKPTVHISMTSSSSTTSPTTQSPSLSYMHIIILVKASCQVEHCLQATGVGAQTQISVTIFTILHEISNTGFPLYFVASYILQSLPAHYMLAKSKIKISAWQVRDSAYYAYMDIYGTSLNP